MRQPIPNPELAADPDAPRPAPAQARGTGTRVWLVRHATVHEDWQQRAYGDLDVPLSDLGLAETRAMAARFAGVPVAQVVASTLARARAMGEGIAAAAGAPLALDANLREVSRGAWQGLATSEFRARWEADAAAFRRDPWNWKGHGGESDADLFARGWPVVEHAVRAHAGGTIVVASHYNLIRALVSGALGLAAHESFAFRIRTAHAALLVDAPDGWRLAARDVPDPAQAAAPRPA